MSRKTEKCLECGEVKTIKARGLCGNCYKRLHRQNKELLKEDFSIAVRRCEVCNKELSKGQIRYCSDECKSNRYIKLCKVCGKEFTTKYHNQQVCSDKCKSERQSEYNKEIRILKFKPKIFICKCCGKEIVSEYGNTIKTFCSKECSKRYSDNRSFKKRLIAYSSKHRTKIVYDANISLTKVYKRYSGICAICGETCNYEDYVITNEGYFIAGMNYPSIDHIKPIAKGGQHTEDNIQLAHRSCNMEKRDYFQSMG